MNKPLSLVHTTNQTEPPQLDGPTEPCVITGPNDPHSVNVQIGDTDDDGDTDDTVYVTFKFSDGRTFEITLDSHRAEYIGGLLKKATAMVEERKDAEMAAWAASLPAPCPLHDGPSVEGTHCTCDGVTDAHGNPIKTDA
ncbi:hypothetical protein [Streptomyces scabiei]|uniref:hypothetical protein n=1 Tax=Streptomyces scabiei TaxID=1930 RepID=UPI0029B2EBCD|nr:hypothetical protein [Streptomyces scabiei]MDX2538612.1 hypothetical protein [Streptomyces scabiei]MDX2799886.1 hypothetical protein [Streptomyces scabiei]MDX2858169.1 hypothetical protein [Streptomyces scabiei]MDX3277864.1 hypothetical protein [Streptomyces scabiei]MDX3828541.1 hypothetical protein [Streptomyces scabiei]